MPDERGVYFIFDGLGCEGLPVYIGKAGTLKDGIWSDQRLPGRLKAKQTRGIGRNRFFRDRIRRDNLSGMSFHWFITIDKQNSVLPHVAEAVAMQAYFDSFNKLPVLNNEY